MSTLTSVTQSTFPVSWDEPFDDGPAFMFDAMHMPHPVTPLSHAAADATNQGFTAVMNELALPIVAYEGRHRNGYRFNRMVVKELASEAEAQTMGEAAEATSKREIGLMIERWHGEHLPRIQALLQRLQAMDVADASNAEVAAMLDEAIAITAELWTIHFRVGFPMLLSMQLFDEFYVDLFGGTDADAHALLLGAVSSSVEAGFSLADLATSARDAGLERVFRETDIDHLLPALEASEQGRAFLTELRAYLDTYGLRQDLFELATPTWREDPSFALASIRNYLIANRDTRAEHADRSRSAEAAAEHAREQLSRYPVAVREQFEAMLQFARRGAFLQEEHNFWIDQQGFALLRLFYLKVAKRLVNEGKLATPDDVFMLYADELRGLATGDPLTCEIDWQALVARRREELAAAWDLTPPPFIGPPPDAPSGESPLERGMLRFFGVPPQPSSSPDELRGTPGARGVATGPARVARTLEEARDLLPGEILVTVTTMPPWTPLFGVAAAVVTESGGPLSHCAIVAREYGIPAVVGAFGATSAIVTGQQITVDGGNGLVKLSA
jgi:pyruvate,water dikinase